MGLCYCTNLLGSFGAMYPSCIPHFLANQAHTVVQCLQYFIVRGSVGVSLSHNPDLNDTFYLLVINIPVKFLIIKTYNVYNLHYVTPI